MFTQKERLILINQYEILKHINAEDADFYERNIQILQNGFTRYYGDVLKSASSHEISEETCGEVVEILNLHRYIKNSYENLSEEQRKKTSEDKVRFKGFDGNEEQDHFVFVQFVLGKHNDQSYIELHDSRGYNTHRNVLPEYRNMLEQWKAIGSKAELSEDELTMILSHKY